MYSIFTRRGDLKDFYKDSPITAIVIIINTIMLLVTIIMGGFDKYTLLDLGAISPEYVLYQNEWYRIIFAAFLHGGFMHFVSNVVIGLFVLSSALERMIGSKKFAFIYFGSLIISGLIVVFFSDPTVTSYFLDGVSIPLMEPYMTVTIGASGAIFGALGSLLYITFYRTELMSPQDKQSVRSLILVNVVLTLLIPGISIAGHVGGILSGFLLSFLVIRRNIFKVIN